VRQNVLPVIFVTLLVDMIGIGMIIPVIPVIFTDPTSPSFLLQGFSLGEQYFVAGVLTALFGFMQFIAAPILGELSDVYGRKRLLTVGVGVLALSQLLFGFGIETGALWLLFVSRAVAGLAGANFSIAQAVIADVTEPKDRAKNFGLIGAAFGIGFILGPTISGWVAHAFNDAAAPFWVATAFGIINVISVSLFLPETHHNRKTEHDFHPLKGIQNIVAAWRDRDARPVYLSSFLHASGFAFFTSFIGILLVSRFGLSESAIGTYFGIVGVWIVVTQLFILRILTRSFGERAILRYSLLFVALSIALCPFMPSILYIYALVPFLAVPNGLTMANMGALVSKSVSSERQGAALGINGSLMALSQGTIPLVAGAFSGGFGVSASFLAGGSLVFAAWLTLFVFMRR
jgi:DHA1 family tetracycline resistance protein-like MFS transporter